MDEYKKRHFEIVSYYSEKRQELMRQMMLDQPDMLARVRRFGRVEIDLYKQICGFWAHQPEMQQLEYKLSSDLRENEEDYCDAMDRLGFEYF
jgi:hypothetical protein